MPTVARRRLFDAMTALAGRPRHASAIAGLLEVTERMPSAHLEREQLARASELVAYARANVPYYGRIFEELAEGTLTMERFRELPILTRENLRLEREALRSRNIPPAHRVVREANSSGSTGKHVTVAVGAASAAVTDAIALRDHAWHRRDIRLKAAGIRAIPAGADAPHGRHEPRWVAHRDSGPLALLDVHTPVRDQLAWLAREAPAYVATYGSNAWALVTCAEHDGVELPALREMGTFGDKVPEGLREACRRTWGVPVVDAYSTVELGYLALQCPEHEHYHVQSENVLLEVLRDDGSSCEAGETGRVVATALHAYAMPLIRYEVGDYVTLGPPCSCGRPLPVLDRIAGRFRNMLRLPSGDVLWPRFASTLIGKFFPLRQFRMIQTSLEDLVLEVALDRPLTSDELAAMRALILDTVRHPFRLQVEAVDAIARSPSGKFEDFVCRIEDDDRRRPGRDGS